MLHLLSLIVADKQVQPNIDVLGWYCTGSELLDEHMEVHTQFLELNGAAAFLLLNPSSEQASHDWPLAMLESGKLSLDVYNSFVTCLHMQ